MSRKYFEAAKVEKLKKLALQLFHKMDRPILVGQVSLHLDISLDRTVEILQGLEDEHHVRPLSEDELKSKKLDTRFACWVLQSKASLALAGDDK